MASNSPFDRPATQTLMQRNLTALWSRATESERRQGADWYPAARRIVGEWSRTYGHSRETVACVIAALSPQTPWPRNLIMADDVLADRPLSIRGFDYATDAEESETDVDGTTVFEGRGNADGIYYVLSVETVQP